MRETLIIAAVSITFLATAGCAHYGALEGDYGKSYNMAKYNQILNPGASKNLEPVTGLNGEAAEANMDKYIESFSKASKKQATKGFVMPVIPADTTGMDHDEYAK